MKWSHTSIGEHCTVTSSKRFHLSDRSNSGIPFFCSKEIIQKIKGEEITECDYIREEAYESVKKQFGVPKCGDLLITTRGTYGIPYVYKENDKFYFADGNLTWLKDFDRNLHVKFLYYWILSYDGQKRIDAIAKGTAQKAVPISLIKKLEIPLPPIDIQIRIADILSAYDDLIENNRKQIKLLEEAAQRLYKKWFIDLRFPGYEDTPIHDGIPEGWERKSVLDCLEMHIGGGWGKETLDGKNVYEGKVIRGTDINDIKSGNYADVPIRYHSENDIKKRKLKPGDIVFELSNGNINNIGRSLFIDEHILSHCGENTICASFCKLFRPKDKCHAVLLYLEIQDMQSSSRMLPYKKHGSNGINNFAFEDFLQHEFLIPKDRQTLKPFEVFLSKISNTQSQMALLSESRDRLLPKLMNGEIEL